MQLVNRSLSIRWVLGIYLMVLVCWDPRSTQARFIAKRETPNGEMGVAAATSDPDIVKPQNESDNELQTTIVQQERLKPGSQDETSTTSPTTSGISFTLASTNEMQSTVNSFRTTDETATTPSKVELTEQPMLKEDHKFTTTTKPEQQLISQVEVTTEATTTSSINSEPTTTTVTTTTTTIASTSDLRSTPREEDRARSMQFPSSTERVSFVSVVTPMKLRPIPMATTTTTTHMPQLLAPLLHAGVTVTPSASDENAIDGQEGMQKVHLQPEKRAKFIADNSTNAQQLTLPNVAEVWSLAALKMVPTPSTTTTATTTTTTTNSPVAGKGVELSNDIEERNQTMQQHKEKNILDWQQIMMMPLGQENHTEPIMMSTSLDATEAATQSSTLKLDITLNQGEVFPAVSKSVTEGTINKTESKEAQLNEWLPITTTEPSINEASTNPPKLPLQEAEDDFTSTSTTTFVPVKSELTENSTLNLTLVESTVTQLSIIENYTTESVVTESITAAAAATLPVSLTTAERATTTTTTTTTMRSALNATPSPHPNTNETAMNSTLHENNENGDKANDVDVGVESDTKTESDDVIDVSVSVSVSTTETTPTATERQTITVSTRTAVEESTATAPTIQTVTVTPTPTPISTSTSTVTPTPQTLHANVDEQIATASTTTTPTPTPTEIVQISNEVNLETITVKQVTTDDINSNSNSKKLLITTGSTAKPINSTVNTEPLQVDNNSTTTVTPPSLLTDENANSKLNEHETSLETNNISETAGIIITTTTTTAAPVPSTRTITEATAAVNRLDVSKAITTTTTATVVTAAKGESVFNEDEVDDQQQNNHDHGTEESLLKEKNMANITTITTNTTSITTTTETATTTTAARTTVKTTTTEEPIINLLDDSTSSTSSNPTTTTTSTTTSPPRPKTTTTAEPIYSSTYSTNNFNNMLPVETTTRAIDLPTTMLIPSRPTELDLMHQPPPSSNSGTDVNVIIAITVSVIGVAALILLVAFLYLMRKRQKQMSYGQRCRPVSLDAYSLDNVSVLGSVRRKGRDFRVSKRTYGNAAFDDPSLRHNMLNATELGKFLERRSSIFEEFRDVPQIIARADEVPAGCEDKNRYANVIPLPETRVVLQRQGDDDKTEYINANYVRGPRDAPNYYIACQAPLESTTGDFWRMIWEQQSRVIVQATDLNENGIERCAEYLPPSVTLDNHSSYGDYQVTLKHREVKDKYAISTLMLKHVDEEECRELTHYWYKWPEAGVPLEEAPIIAMLLEARSSLKSYALEQANELKEKSSTLKSMDNALNNSADVDTKKAEEVGSASSGPSNEINGNVTNKQPRSQQGPLTIHCSPGTGRTGTIIACDMAIRSLETPKRFVDIPQLVYYVRRGRASSVQTKEQYEFIYKVANMYATKITNLSNDN
ncbi:mucin-2 isoform X1 [Drosophila sulfurigaster albostrigata]|uniref:mucin-2 isoform X1 n=1 Tax=Drosophila sulfurigaster albostrigata TaxID=89887 RepID=UPI002D21B805|nr:mucin-2 isoform X1 [Drosophila sulfurigaster albostrigata]